MHFQATKAEKRDTHLLVQTMNRAPAKGALTPAVLDRAFERWWPDLQQALEQIPLSNTAVNTAATRRSDRDLLDEILERVGSIERGKPPVDLGDAEGRILDFVISSDTDLDAQSAMSQLREYLARSGLRRSEGNIEVAARALGVASMTLRQWLRQN